MPIALTAVGVSLVAACYDGSTRQREVEESSAGAADATYETSAPQPYSEAERTHTMEARAAEMNRKLEEARAGGLSEQEAQRAFEEFERERAELNRISESGSAPAESEAPAFQPPPS